jgi:hypothetical protein
MGAAQEGAPGVRGDDLLGGVPGHDREVGAGLRGGLGGAQDPGHALAAGARAGDLEHGRGRIDADHAMAVGREVDAEDPRPAADVQDRERRGPPRG